MLDPTTRLNAALEGRYRIERQLGEGGMATVYLADDLRHGRKVALKVLKPELAALVGAERFLAEIKTTANLQHPHILPLFDSGEADSLLFYVMPYVEGESLRERLDRERQLPVDEAVQIAMNVAEALDYAHRQGVIHRDIKPPNILLQDGKPVISDFGIARALGVAGSRLTETGLSLGTPHYMSPEQATGDPTVGPATDTYALGCVLYEMLVGQPPYAGSTAQAVLAKIVMGEPDPVTEHRSSVPRNVDAAIRTALAKTPADRFRTVGRFGEALRDPAFGGVARSSATPMPPGVGRYLWPIATATALVLAGYFATRDPPPSPTTRSQITLPEGRRLGVRGGRSYVLDVSRDGSVLVYVGEEGTDVQLYLRRFDSFTSRVLPGTRGARQPFFASDGEWVGFFADGELRRVPVSGGAPISVTTLPEDSPCGGSWGADDRILYCAGNSIYGVSVDGDSPIAYPLPERLADIQGRSAPVPETGARPLWPHLLPDGRHALVTIQGATAVLDLNTGEYRHLFEGGQARYLPTGHLIYNGGRERALLVPFDLDRLEIEGPSRPAVEDVFRGPGSGALNLAVSDNGTLVYVRGGFLRELVLADRTGRETPVPVDARGYRFPRVSPDGRYLAVTVDPRPSDLWIVDLERGSAVPQSTDPHDGWGVWSPDGRKVAFWGGDLDRHLWVRDFPFAGPAVPIGGPDHGELFPMSWALDDRLLAEGLQISAIDVNDGSVEVLIPRDEAPAAPRISPDGRWLAYHSMATGVSEVYVVAYPGLGQRHLVSRGGGADPSWSADGTELFYRNGNSILTVPVRTLPSFEVVGEPETLFIRPYNFFQEANWTSRPQGDFVMIRSDPTSSGQIQYVQNWFTELCERMGDC